MDLYTLNEILKLTKNKEKFLKKNNIDFKEHEIKTLTGFLEHLLLSSTIGDVSFFTDYFIFGYSIPQIGEEFDLLRFGNNFNVNIEFKSIYNEEKILKQLIRKKHYLNFLEMKSIHITYSLDTDTCYILGDNNNLIEIGNLECFNILMTQEVVPYHTHDEVSKVFDIKNYLISPFNTTDKFLNGEYFLTSHQEIIKKQITDKNIPNKDIILIEGNAGTGKTLLLYDLVMESKKSGLKSKAFHCASLNSGHYKLIESGLDISGAKKITELLKSDSNYDIIFVDESQRLYPNQLEIIVEYANRNKIPCIFSIDQKQCLHNVEIANNIEERLSSIVKVKYKLSEKIRTNKELAKFIKSLNEYHVNSYEVVDNTTNNIKLRLFYSLNEAEKFIQYMCNNKDYKYLSYATDLIKKDDLDEITNNGTQISSHKVIGQEFDKIIVAVDNKFGYTVNDSKTVYKLAYGGKTYYHATNMLIQNLTRTRRELCIVFVNNPFMFKTASILLTNN